MRICVVGLLSITLLLTACATSYIRPGDLEALGSAPTADEVMKVAHGSPLYRLDYLVDGHTFIYETYAASDTGRYYGLLFQEGKLLAADVIGRSAAYGPPAGRCTRFPPSVDLDVSACLQDFNRNVEAAAVDVSSDLAPVKAASDRVANDTAGTVAEGAVITALLAPIMIPAAIITLPFVGASSLGDDSRRKSLDVNLGDSYDDIRARVEQYPDKYRSVTDGNGTVLIPGSIVPNASAAFGVEHGKVIWIDLSPNTACGGGFMFWGMKCTMDGQ